MSELPGDGRSASAGCGGAPLPQPRPQCTQAAETGCAGGGPSARRPALAVVLVASGAAALLHEMVWFRVLVPILGAGAIPPAAVTAGALLGLAAGSALGGRLADRSPRPLRVLASGEAVAAAAGIAVPLVLPACDRLPPAFALPAAVALLAAAAVPWGVSIPAVVRATGPAPGTVGRTFGHAYAWNTLGAVAGVVVGAAWLLEAAGNRGTAALAAGMQAVLAAVVFGSSLRARAAGSAAAPGGAPADTEPAGAGPGQPARAVPGIAIAAAAMLAGAAGAGVQVAWVRRLTPVLSATFQVFAAVLAVHLAGIAIGAALPGPRRGARPAAATAALLAAAAVAAAATPFALGPMVDAVAETWWAGYGDPFAMLGLRIAVTAILVLPPVVLGAAVLPWLVRADSPGPAGCARRCGSLVAWNAAGSAGGGIAAALWAIPVYGTSAALMFCAAALLAAAGCLTSGRARAAFAAASAGAVLTGAGGVFSDRAADEAVGTLYSRASGDPADRITRFRADGRMASVLVRDRDGRLEFWVEGSFESSTGPTDRFHLTLLGHLPLVLWKARTERAPHVVLIGLGGGFTAQAAARHAPASLTIHELEPEVVRASGEFRAAGGGVPAGAEVVLTDGRRAAIAGERPMDILSADPVHPALGGSAALFSADFWRGAMARLPDDGLLVQWLPLYQLHPEDLRLTLRTFVASVPEPYVFLAGPDAILVGTRTPLRLGPAALDAAIASGAAAPLAESGLRSAGRFLSLLAAGPAELRSITGLHRGAGDVPPGAELNTDDRLLLEFRSGWREAGDPGAAQEVLTANPADPRSLFAGGPEDPRLAAGIAAGAVLRTAMAAWTRRDYGDASRRFAAIASADPSNELARRMRDEADVERAYELLAAGREAAASRVARAVAARPAAEPLLRLDAAEILLSCGFPDEAREIARPYAASHAWPRAVWLASADDR